MKAWMIAVMLGLGLAMVGCESDGSDDDLLAPIENLLSDTGDFIGGIFEDTGDFLDDAGSDTEAAGKSVVDGTGRVIGEVADETGKVVDDTGRVIGHVIEDTGDVIDNTGRKIGTVLD